MRLQNKLMLGALVIILVWSGIYFAFSLNSAQMVLDRYEGFVQKQMTVQLQNTLIDYYVSHGESWRGVDQSVLPMTPPPRGRHSGREAMVLLDPEGRPAAVWPPRGEPGRDADMANWAVRLPLQVDGRTVGTLLLHDGALVNLEGARIRLAESLVNSILVAFVVSSLLAMAVSYLLANRISRPLHQLAQGAAAVKQRRFDMRIPVTSKDEVGTAIQAFNEMSAELQRGEQVRRNLVADVAHELRTPLTVIRGQLESIQQGVLPASVETVLPIHDEVIRLNGLVDDLHHLTLAEAGQLPLRRVPSDVGQVVQRVADNFQVIAEGQGIALEFRKPDAPVVLHIDPDRVTQVVVNLLSNALRHTPNGGRIEVGVREAPPMGGEGLARFCADGSTGDGTGEKGGGVLVWVADSGPGIKAEHLPFIFERFYRSDPSRDRERGGAGLGLAIAREFVMAQGGRIAAANRSGGGSCFAFFLPADEVLTKS